MSNTNDNEALVEIAARILLCGDILISQSEKDHPTRLATLIPQNVAILCMALGLSTSAVSNKAAELAPDFERTHFNDGDAAVAY